MLIVDQVALGALFSGKDKHEFLFALHINPLTARVWDHTSPAMQAIVALYFILYILNYYIKAINHKFSMGYRLINHLGCW